MRPEIVVVIVDQLVGQAGLLRRLELGAGGRHGIDQRRGGGAHLIERRQVLAQDNGHVLDVEAGHDVVLIARIGGKLPPQTQVQLQAAGHAVVVLDIRRIFVLADIVHPLGDPDIVSGISQVGRRRDVARVPQGYPVRRGAMSGVVKLRRVGLECLGAGGSLLLWHPVVPVGAQVDTELDFMLALHLGGVVFEDEIVEVPQVPVYGLDIVGGPGADTNVVDYRETGLAVRVRQTQLAGVIYGGIAGETGGNTAAAAEQELVEEAW